jgi:thiamine pyrophosphokinase
MPIVDSLCGVTLAGGAPFSAKSLAVALALAPCVVAADGGADRLRARGARPSAVIGDMDSISAAARAALADVLHPFPQQDNTDFDKALAHIRAPFILGLGFWGARADHGLAALAGMVRAPHRCVILLGAKDLVFLAPPSLRLDLRAGTRVSLFPMGAVQGSSSGLRWPIGGIDFAPDGMIGTSNQALGPVDLAFDAAKMLVILPINQLDAALQALVHAR